MPLYYSIVDCFIINKKVFVFIFIYIFSVQIIASRTWKRNFPTKNDTIKESANNNNKT